MKHENMGHENYDETYFSNGPQTLLARKSCGGKQKKRKQSRN